VGRATFRYNFSLKEIVMGKHDKRTRRGKITRGTFGKSRPRKATKAATPAKKKAPAKKK
jgi:30S ribosomal protein S31